MFDFDKHRKIKPVLASRDAQFIIKILEANTDILFIGVSK